MRLACWTTKATDTYSEYAILIAFPLQRWLQERASLLRYRCSACQYVSNEVDFCMSDSIAQIPFSIEDSCRLGYGCVWCGGQFPTFRSTVVSIFRVKPPFRLFIREDEGITIFRNVVNYWPNSTAVPTRSIVALTALVLYSLVI